MPSDRTRVVVDLAAGPEWWAQVSVDDSVVACMTAHTWSEIVEDVTRVLSGEAERPSLLFLMGSSREVLWVVTSGWVARPFAPGCSTVGPDLQRKEVMSEAITTIRPYDGEHDYGREAGFQIETTEQVITLAIYDEASCCESWGYFLTEDDTTKFVGAVLLGLEVTDTNRSTKTFKNDFDAGEDTNIYIDDGDVLFVDIRTDRGVLQFVAYNAHNGYYGHTARVSSKQLQHKVTL